MRYYNEKNGNYDDGKRTARIHYYTSLVASAAVPYHSIERTLKMPNKLNRT